MDVETRQVSRARRRLETAQTNLPNFVRGVANGADSASWGNSTQNTFSFAFLNFLQFCRYFRDLRSLWRAHEFLMRYLPLKAYCSSKGSAPLNLFVWVRGGMG